MIPENTCCFTGPRPQRLPMGGDGCCEEVIELKNDLKTEIINAYNDGYRNFMSGMAEGFDLFAAETVIALKEEYDDIKLIAVFPAPECARNHSYDICEIIEEILLKADMIINVQNSYSYGCELKRNIYMVDNSMRIIGYFNDCSPGTAHCWKYAQSKGIEMRNICKE